MYVCKCIDGFRLTKCHYLFTQRDGKKEHFETIDTWDSQVSDQFFFFFFGPRVTLGERTREKKRVSGICQYFNKNLLRGTNDANLTPIHLTLRYTPKHLLPTPTSGEMENSLLSPNAKRDKCFEKRCEQKKKNYMYRPNNVYVTPNSISQCKNSMFSYEFSLKCQGFINQQFYSHFQTGWADHDKYILPFFYALRFDFFL